IRRLYVRTGIPPYRVGVLLTDPGGVVYAMNPMVEVLLAEQAVEMMNKPLDWPLVDGTIINVDDRQIRVEIMETAHANCVLLHDVTPQEQHEREEIEVLRSELKKSHEIGILKERFTAMIAHEFGTPLSVIRAKSDILNNHLERLPRAKISQYLQNIDAQVSHLGDLIDDLAFINRAYAAQEIFQPEPLDLKPFCQDLLDQTVRRWSGRAVNFTCTGQWHGIQLDRRLVRYIVSNLVSNALKYSPSGGEVRMDIHGADQEVIFSVSDQGIGIPADELDKIFNPLYRASNASNFNGMGLGLAMVKTSVEACGGGITVQSELGKGTTFLVVLPHQTPL
ncbi:MAG: HAMP domain-containing histidine kinase, partial [Acidobacteriales bacterium]|nr:HAMP domain-containing histidine kinase [Terriglobales bacterium]